MTAAARALLLDDDRWRWLDGEARIGGATAIVLGTYVVFAFDRFGWPDFAFRSTVRLVLIGFYGWMGLALAGWAITRFGFKTGTGPASFVRLAGHAHLPLLLVALVILVVAVMLDAAGFARWPAVFVGGFWFPGQLVGAMAAAGGLDRPRAAAAAVLPYLVWLVVVGRHLWRQMGHLL